MNVSTLTYQLQLITADGVQHDLTGIAQSFGWEENKSEVAVRISASLINCEVDDQRISDLAKPGTMLVLLADWDEGSAEVARGTVCDWDPSFSGGAENLELVAYDNLYPLQQSQDYAYFAAGTGTKASITKLLADWNVPLVKYEGPDVPHGETLYKNEYISDMLLMRLKDAESLGAPRCFMRYADGGMSVLAAGSNSRVYQFEEDNTLSVRDHLSTADLVTRVKIVGKEDAVGRRPVEAVLDGHTEFGIRQRIYDRPDKSTLTEAQTAAKQIISESGEPIREIQVEAPDVPDLRRGDKAHFTTGTLDGYFLVAGVQHDAAGRSMALDLEPMPKPPVEETPAPSGTFEVGDAVILNGTVHNDSYGNRPGATFKNYKGKVTIKVDTTRACPYHVDAKGWVYPNTITKA